MKIQASFLGGSIMSDSVPMDGSTERQEMSFTVSQSSLRLIHLESVMPSNHLILCPPHSPPALNLSPHQGLSNKSVPHIRWPKYWSFSFSISSSSEYPGLISFRMDWFGLLAVQEDSEESFPTPQFKSINSSVLNILYGPTLISTHNYWKNYSFDYMDLCWQNDVSAF